MGYLWYWWGILIGLLSLLNFPAFLPAVVIWLTFEIFDQKNQVNP